MDGPALFARRKRPRADAPRDEPRTAAIAAPAASSIAHAPLPPSTRGGFGALGLSPWLVHALGAMSLRAPTPIQRACVPAVLAGRDVLGCAQTGSGKTAAFALPILQRLGADPWGIAALVLTPSRELAFQIGEQFSAFGAPMHVRVSVVTGGQDLVKQGAELSRQPHVLIATPGRLAHMLSAGAAPPDLSRAGYLVLDECDRLCADSFRPDLHVILAAMPPGRAVGGTRQTLLFSATPSPAALAIPGLGLDTSHLLFDAAGALGGLGAETSGPLTVATLTQHYLFIPAAVKNAYLISLLLAMGPPDLQVHVDARSKATASAAQKRASEKAARASAPKAVTGGGAGTGAAAPAPDADMPLARSIVVFVSSCMSCALVAELCVESGIPCAALHSVMPQAARLASLAKFRSAVVRVLIATDVASRGLDLPTVDLVLNYDVPRAPDDYVHRVGRTARAGRAGRSLTLVTPYEVTLLQAIEAGALRGMRLSELPPGTITEAAVLARLTKVAAALELAKARLVDIGFIDALGIARRRKREAREARGVEK